MNAPTCTHCENPAALGQPTCAEHSRTAPVRQLLQFFVYGHLPEPLQKVSMPFAALAQQIANGPQNTETTTALRKLLEAKDCAVRAVLAK